jgi:hypothetical protein
MAVAGTDNEGGSRVSLTSVNPTTGTDRHRVTFHVGPVIVIPAFFDMQRKIDWVRRHLGLSLDPTTKENSRATGHSVDRLRQHGRHDTGDRNYAHHTIPHRSARPVNNQGVTSSPPIFLKNFHNVSGNGRCFGFFTGSFRLADACLSINLP